MKEGLVQVYTGDGKGKTTAATGLAVRAAGRGLKVIFIRFLKKDDSGEVTMIEKNIPEIKFMKLNSQDKFIWNMNEEERELLRKETREGIIEAMNFAKNGTCDVLVLDEIFGAYRNGFISEDDILNLIKVKHNGVELVLTGRDAPRVIIEAADLVTKMENIKHPFDAGIKARTGIER
jgi:cob(I)alamin adenosyltransferase